MIRIAKEKSEFCPLKNDSRPLSLFLPFVDATIILFHLDSIQEKQVRTSRRHVRLKRSV